MFRFASVRLFILPILFMIADLLIKVWLINTLEPGESIQVAGDAIVISRIQELSMAYGIGDGMHAAGILRIAFQVIFLVFFFMALRAPIQRLIKFAMTIIIAGWVGIYADRFLFSDGTAGYLQLQYISFASLPYTSLTSLVLITGWVLFIAIAAIRFRELRLVFKRG